MSELYIPALEKVLGIIMNDERIQNVIVDTVACNTQSDHQEQLPKRQHLRTLSIRRNRDVRIFLMKLREANPDQASLMEKIDRISNRNDQFKYNFNFMDQLMQIDPDFRAIFEYYNNLRTWVNDGTYKPANQSTDMQDQTQEPEVS
ncbi:hypothetical protein EXS70_01700 [Candidatus Peribacteria bacterium]|nr:hypothetical protein [Candidatus Peribacteria bacterium]